MVTPLGLTPGRGCITKHCQYFTNMWHYNYLYDVQIMESWNKKNEKTQPSSSYWHIANKLEGMEGERKFALRHTLPSLQQFSYWQRTSGQEEELKSSSWPPAQTSRNCGELRCWTLPSFGTGPPYHIFFKGWLRVGLWKFSQRKRNMIDWHVNCYMKCRMNYKFNWSHMLIENHEDFLNCYKFQSLSVGLHD